MPPNCPMYQFFKQILFVFLIFSSGCLAQKKIMVAKSTSEKIIIDGEFSESAWQTAPIAGDFIMYQPDNGKPIDSTKRSDIRILYDDEAVYIAATLFDNEPDKILKEITQRDNIGTADIFGVFINGFNDGQQDFQFFVSASGVQIDRLATEDGEVAPDNFQDFSWDAIWASEVKITNFGWTVEMKIPYAALRFSKEKVQTWGLNFFRNIRRDRQSYTWSPIDLQIKATRTQNGILEGIENIKPPTRLFFIPYSSYYYENNQSGSGNKFKAGLDIKYGINDSFTLDAILVPDFGQTKFDNVILNLSPYEQQFAENRPFFTEGTDLFNKANLFYSRRIGGRPRFLPKNYAPGEEIQDAPTAVNLLNAIKISGRTKNGLGIGFLNAITESTYATVENTNTGTKRQGIIEPLTNYNVLVLDQRFNQNSSVSLTNTNVWRNGNYRDANVSAFLFDLNTKENSYNLSGDFKYSTISANPGGDFNGSYVNKTGNYDGFKTALNFEKTSGKYRFTLFGKYLSANYDINDLGYGAQTNYHNAYADFSYRILNPTKLFNTFRIDVKSGVEIQNTTGKIQDNFYNLTIGGNSRNNDYYSAFFQINPIETFDFYQPRNWGRFSYVPRSFVSNVLFSSNYNDTFAVDIRPIIRLYDEKERMDYGFYFSPRYRINDKILLIYSFDYFRNLNDRGYVGQNQTDIFYAQRNIKTIENVISGKFSLSNTMAINLAVRYYWSYSENKSFFTLRQDGYLDNTNFIDGINNNVASWNLDLSYSWWFAPASQISVLYRNYAQDRANIINRSFDQNFNNLIKDNLNNTFSVSIRYYIDYNRAKNWF